MREATLSRGSIELFANEDFGSRPTTTATKQQAKKMSNPDLVRNIDSDGLENGLPKLKQNPLQIYMAKPPPPELVFGGANASAGGGGESVNTAIQQIWSLFATMSDSQRNSLLRGLLARSSSKQIDTVCTSLNLKISEPSLGHSPTVFTPEAFKKLGTSRSSKKVNPKTSSSGRPLTRKAATEDERLTPPKLPVLESRGKEFGDESSLFPPLNQHVRFGDYNEDVHRSTEIETAVGGSFGTIHATDRLFRDLNVSLSPAPAQLPNTFHSPHPSFMNANAYVRLLNSSYDYQAILKQSQKANSESTKAIVNFLAGRCKKMQEILQCMFEVATEGDSEKAMATLLNCALSAVDGKNACLYTIDETTSEIIVRSSNWVEPGSVTSTDKIFWGLKVLKGEIVNVYNAKTSEQYTDEIHEQYGKLEMECIMMAPIFTEQFRVSGIIEIVNKSTPGAAPYFNAEDEFVLKALSSVWTLLLNHSHVRQQALRKSDDIRVLLNTASLMSSELDLGDLIRVIMQTAQELLGAERCALFMIDKEKGELWSSLAQGSGEIRIPMNKGIAAYNDTRFNRSIDMKTGFKTRNILCMPMRNTQGEIIGVTQIINKLPESSTFTKEDELLLMAFSALAAVTIEKSILFKALQVTLHETSQTRNFLSMILQSISNVVITLDKNGRLLTINHPAKLEMEDMIATMRLTSFDYWLGKENSILIADIQRAYRGEGTISAQDYELVLNDKSRSVNYNIVQMTDQAKSESDDSLSSADSGDGEESVKGERKRVTGVVIVMEDISKEKRVMGTLGRYMNPALVHKVMSEGGNALGGTRQKISVVFADLRNCKTLDPSHVVSLLNLHYTSIVDAIMAESGILDKYIGDAAMAVFGVPFVKSDDSIRAVASSLRMKNGLEALNKRNKILNLPILKMGIGISTGMVLSGNIGSPKRMEYTVIGEAVNIASRIENATKLYGTMILICDKTREEVKDHFHLREVDAVVVKGKTIPVTIYEVLGPMEQDLPHEVMTALVCYELGLTEYRNQNWSVAMSHFKKAIQITDDNPSKTFLDRCKGILEGLYEVPPLGTWDGCWKFTTK
ncbi:hypothetical protein HDU97_006969 [Phlyctochytrium planicorne]|nr:hypothetical protein HDU97_006969 [Phlyctochytrium planicorne]